MSNLRPDYFCEVTPMEYSIRRIKGDYRRGLVLYALGNEECEPIPTQWLEHNLSNDLKDYLGAQNPGFRGGEDLPDLREGEIEIVRISLLDSVHHEVTSLRAIQNSENATIQLHIVDEYGEDYILPQKELKQPLTAKEALCLIKRTQPSPVVSSCNMAISSDFYPDLDALADKLGVKKIYD